MNSKKCGRSIVKRTRAPPPYRAKTQSSDGFSIPSFWLLLCRRCRPAPQFLKSPAAGT